MRRVLYLDNYYYYAPVPRVTRFTGIYRFLLPTVDALLAQRSLFKFSFFLEAARRLQESSIVSDLLGLRGHSRQKPRLDLEALARATALGEEALLLLEFILFHASVGDEAEIEDRLRRGECPDSTRITPSREAVRGARRTLRELHTLMARRGQHLLRLLRLYAVCRVSRLMGIKRIIWLDYGSSEGSHWSSVMREALEECSGACGYRGGHAAHREDARSMKALLDYVFNEDFSVLVATVASIGVRSGSGECFACLADSLSRKYPDRLIHLKQN